MILLATLLATQLAPGCRQIGGAVRCELGPAVRVAPPKPATAPASPPPRHAHTPESRRASPAKPKPKPAAPPTPEQIAHHVALLVAAADCTGARTLVAATESPVAAETLFQTCLRTATGPGSSGRDVRAVPGDAAAGVGAAKPVQHP